MKGAKSLHRFLLPCLVLLFIIQVLLLPAALRLTFASRSVNPEHILTYAPGSLQFDSDTEVLDNGSARLSLFEAAYSNVLSESGEKVIAPGTKKNSIIRLKNNSKGEISYTAVLWSNSTAKEETAVASLSGEGFSDTAVPTLPAGIEADAVIRVVEGKVASQSMQDFDIGWIWNFEDAENSEARDLLDTAFGNKSADGAPDSITVGFYIVVTDGGVHVTPEAPKTGDTAAVLGYGLCFVLSVIVLLLLIFDRRKAKKYES